jgi:hypothetical protein
MIGTTQSGMTLGAMMLDVAQEFGLARIVSDDGQDAAPSLPSEPSRLAKIKRAVVDGYRRFILANPKWAWLRVSVTVTLDPTGTGPSNLDGDPTRYRLPVGVASSPYTGWLLRNPGTQTVGLVTDTSERRVFTHQAINRTPGVPVLACVTPFDGDPTGARRLVVSPAPDQPYTLTGTFRLDPPDLDALDQPHLAGSKYNFAILACAKAAFAESDADGTRRQEYRAAAADALVSATMLNGEEIENTLGEIQDADTDVPQTRADVRRSIPTIVTYGG